VFKPLTYLYQWKDMAMKTNDEIYPLTRWVALVVIPFLWGAFYILYFNPDSSGERFAWAIKPHMTALFIGAGYLGGSWLFIRALIGKRWHHIQGGFMSITTFTWFMIVATFLHWDRFSHGRFGFNMWLILYLITPILVPVLWYMNRKEDSGAPEENDIKITLAAGLILKLIAVGILAFVLFGFINPTVVIQIWPWTLTPLTARVMCGWIALLGAGALAMSNETRWSGWKVPLESMVIWHVLVIVAAIMNPADFKTGFANWYILAVAGLLLGIFILYPIMEIQRYRAK
jgi:hypothetical protein